MPFYYTLREKAAEAGYLVYMGKDKFENEVKPSRASGCAEVRLQDLLKYGWPEDLWFHVDKLSSGAECLVALLSCTMLQHMYTCDAQL